MIPNSTLQDSHHIPQIGFGLWQVKDQAQFDTAFDAAWTAGYRHFDSAQAYDNEQMLGNAIKRNNIARDNIFITTKIAVEHFGYKHTLSSVDDSLKNLQTNYVDLMLLHFPVTLLRKKSWMALEEIKAAGKAKSIGVSNYTIKHLEQMKEYAKELPVVNQVELHVFLQQPELLAYCAEHQIAVEAYSPLAHAQAGSEEPVLRELSEKYGKTYAQIMLRWCLQKGLIVLPKSVTPERIKENIAIFDFVIDAADMQKLASLDRDLRTCWSPVHVP